VYGEMTRIANCYRVSRLFVYQLRWQLLLLYELKTCAADSPQAIKEYVDRHILLLRLEGRCSLAQISQIIRQLGLPYSSLGYISQRLTAYARRLPAESLAGAQIQFLLSDEIFTLGRPILITAEPRSLAILKIELAEQRDAETWRKHWEQLVKAGVISHPIVVSDQGSGLIKGCGLLGLTHHPDLFHLLQGLAKFGERFYRQALAAIAREYERGELEVGRSEGVIKRRGEAYEAAKAEAQAKIRRYDNFCYLWRELLAALELFDRQGRLPELAARQAEIAAILELMGELGCEQLQSELKSFAAALESYGGYYQRAEAVYRQLLERYPAAVVQALGLGWQLQRQATNSKDSELKQRLKQAAEFYFGYAASLMPEQAKQYEALRQEVLEALEGEVRSSSLVENVNSALRPLLETCRGQVGQELLDLFAYVHNRRRFVRGKRADRAPIELLTGKKLEKTWLESLLELEVA